MRILGKRMIKHKQILLTIVVLIFCKLSISQVGLCPPNMDFENNNFSNWECRYGGVKVVGNVNTLNLSSTGQVNGRHTIIAANGSGLDLYGMFPVRCPNGSGYSVKLGNSLTGSDAESLSYIYTIPSTLTEFSLLYYYAVVFEDPGHSPEEQPRFRATVTDLSSGSILPCMSFDFTASASLPGFKKSSIDDGVIYKDWTPISINLNDYIGRTIKIEFITSDCTLGGHFGYAYVDVNSACNGVITGNFACVGDTSVTLQAPYGFQNYRWYSDNTFTQLLSDSATLFIYPQPQVGVVYPVIVEPFPSFGCNDTLRAIIAVAQKPTSYAGRDTSICKYAATQLGTTATTALSYEWTPQNQVNNPIVSNPIAHLKADTTMFIVKTKNILTGCYTYDTTIVSPLFVDTSITVTGKSEFCNGDLLPAILTVSDSVYSIQWYNSNSLISGASSKTIQPSMSGKYWASVSQNGCKDSTKICQVIIHPLPKAEFATDIDSGCISSSMFNFINSSYSSDNSSMSYLWKFDDGDAQTAKNVSKNFSKKGLHTAKLTTTTMYGCKDSVYGKVQVLYNGTPNFEWDSICQNNLVEFRNLSNENGWPKTNYTWDFNNGNGELFLKNPGLVSFDSAGFVDVTLKMTIVGCENNPQSITKSVFVKKPVKGIRYYNIAVPHNTTKTIMARKNIGYEYDWLPRTNLSSYSERVANFYATGNDVLYFVNITDDHKCVTTDTLQVVVLNNGEYYMPSGFTPNSDGLNDIAKPYLVNIKSFTRFSIYNRWGDLIFQTTKPGEGWDGKYKGVSQPVGTYLWVLSFITNDNRVATEKGTLTLIR